MKPQVEVPPKLVVVALTEDTNGDATKVVLGLVRLLLTRVIDPATQTQHLRFEPYDAVHRPVVAANIWQSTSGRDQQRRTELNKYLARVASQQPLHVVVHHFDADERWDARRPCVRLELWRARIAGPIARQWGEEVAARLVPLVPHPELEGWLYLNVERLAALAAATGCAAPTPPPGGWDAVAGVKDEHPWPRDTHNLALLHGYPTADAVESSPSLAATVTRISAVPHLLDTLASTHTPV